MKPFFKITFPLFLASLASVVCLAATKLDVSRLTAVPDGNYLVTLELDGKQERLNVKVDGNKAKCVNSSDATLKDMEGEFRANLQQRGVFAISFRSPRSTMTQIWIF